MDMELKARQERILLESSSLDTTLAKIEAALSRYGIKWTICGGLAVQYWGYARRTSDIDVIVDDFRRARIALMDSGFVKFMDKGGYVHDRFVDPQSGTCVDLLPGGVRVNKSDKLEIPMPSEKYLPLPQLIAAKLVASGSAERGQDSMQDLADVGKLIKANSLPRDYKLAPQVQPDYEKIWDAGNLKEDKVSALVKLMVG